MTHPPDDALVSSPSTDNELGGPRSTSYDALPYESHPYEKSHPDHLAALGHLFGVDRPRVEGCRVLELGCAAGGNLIPQAVAAPERTFVGVDLSRRQLEEGWRLIEQLGLKNVELRHQDMIDFEVTPGEFDFILCHGVYSWVARPVQDKILQICGEGLAPQGIAYISYNTYPGWYLRGMVRQMMCFHARQFDDPQKQVEQARALLDFLTNTGPLGDPTYHTLLCRELEILKNRADSYLYHEHLEEENEPLFFYQFIDRAAAHGLKYLSETQFSEMVPGNFSAQAEETLRELGIGMVQSEQYLDFLRNRTFRRTLLCHDDLELNRQLGPEQLKRLYVGCQLRPNSERIDVSSDSELQFVSPGGVGVTVSQPLVKSAMLQLGEIWPNLVLFDSLPALAHEGLGAPLVRDAANFARDLADLGSLVLELYAADLIELGVSPPRFRTSVSDRPQSSPLARLQAERVPYVTNLRHVVVHLTDLQVRLAKLLDGTRDREALCDALQAAVNAGELVVDRYGQPLSDEDARGFLLELIDRDLQNLVGMALLIA